MKRISLFASLVLAASLLSACATTGPNPISAEQRANLKIVDYDVQYTAYKRLEGGRASDEPLEVAFVLHVDDNLELEQQALEVDVNVLKAQHEEAWQQEYARRGSARLTTFQKEQDDKRRAREERDVKRLRTSYATREDKRRILGKLDTRVREVFADTTSGTQPVELHIDVYDIGRGSIAQTVLIGGSDSINAKVEIVDQATGEVLGEYQTHAAQSKGGLLDALVSAAMASIIENNLISAVALDLERQYNSD